MTFEKPLKGNPHKLTILQHTFPRASINRFLDLDGRVEVLHIPTKKRFRTTASDKVFCAERIWDQRSEESYMKEIEDNFQSVANSIINESISKIGIIEKSIINDFFALWNIRSYRKHLPIPDHLIHGIAGVSRELSKDEQEHLEKNHIGFIRPDQTMPGRLLCGINIQSNLEIARKHLHNAEWGIIRAKEGEFLVPDNYSNVRMVPLTPTACLFSRSKNTYISLQDVSKINQLSYRSGREFYFSRKLSNCPL